MQGKHAGRCITCREQLPDLTEPISSLLWRVRSAVGCHLNGVLVQQRLAAQQRLPLPSQLLHILSCAQRCLGTQHLELHVIVDSHLHQHRVACVTWPHGNVNPLPVRQQHALYRPFTSHVHRAQALAAQKAVADRQKRTPVQQKP